MNAAAVGRERQDGFALLDVLVALALVSFIVVLSTAGLRFAMAAWRLEGDRASQEESDAGILRLRQWITQALPLTTVDPGDGLARLWFLGHEGDLTLVTLSEATALPGGPLQLRLSLVDDGPASHDRSLVAEAAVFRPTRAGMDGAVRTTILRHVLGWRLRYFGIWAPGQEPSWRDTWIEGDHLPLAIRIAISFRDGDLTRERVMLVSLGMAAP